MAINKNHEFEELDGVKCAIVERKATQARVTFLRDLLTYNRYTVVVIPTPVAKAPAPKEGETATAAPPPPDTFTIGVTDVTFNPTNAIFGRLLRTRNGHVVTLAYWQQKEQESHDDIPYYEHS